MSGLYKKAGGTFIFKFFGLGIAFIFQILLGRVLSPELYGEYTMYLTYSSVFSIITIMGMDRNLIKEIARYQNNKAKERSLLKFALIASLSSTLLLVLILYFQKFIFISNYGLFILIVMILIKSITSVLDGYLQGKGHVLQVTLWNAVLNNVLRMIFFIILLFLGVTSFDAAIYSFITSEVITVFLRSVYIHNILGDLSKSQDKLNVEEKKIFIKYSLTVALISGISLMLQNIDKIMISSYLDLADVGIYKVAQNYVNLISVFVTPFIAFWPMISRLYNENKINQIENHMKKIVELVSYLVIPMFFIFLFLSNDLLAIFGEYFVTKEASLVLIILAFSFLIDAVSGPIGSILTMTKYANLSLYNNGLSLIINITLNMMLIKNYGIMGVAIATGISIIVNNLISIIQVKKLLGVFSYGYRNIIQILLMGGFNYIIGKNIVKIIAFENIYFRIISFGLLIYFCNFMVMLIVYKEDIKTVLDRRKK